MANGQAEKPILTVVLIVAAFALFIGITVGMLTWAKDNIVTASDRKAAERVEKLKNLKAMEAYTLSSYGWVNEEAGVARLPIDRAMDLTLETLKVKPIKVAGFIDAAKEAERLKALESKARVVSRK